MPSALPGFCSNTFATLHVLAGCSVSQFVNRWFESSASIAWPAVTTFGASPAIRSTPPEAVMSAKVQGQLRAVPPVLPTGPHVRPGGGVHVGSWPTVTVKARSPGIAGTPSTSSAVHTNDALLVSPGWIVSTHPLSSEHGLASAYQGCKKPPELSAWPRATGRVGDRRCHQSTTVAPAPGRPGSRAASSSRTSWPPALATMLGLERARDPSGTGLPGDGHERPGSLPPWARHRVDLRACLVLERPLGARAVARSWRPASAGGPGAGCACCSSPDSRCDAGSLASPMWR